MFQRLVRTVTLVLVVATTLWLGSLVGRRSGSGLFDVVSGSDLRGRDRAAIELYERFGESERLPDGYLRATRTGGIVGMALVAAAWTALGLRRLRRRGEPGR